MKNLIRFTLITWTVIWGCMSFASCSSNDDEQLSGTYYFDSVYDCILYFSDGTYISFKEEGALNDFLMSDPTVQEFISIMTPLGFRFKGSKCYLNYYGEEDPDPANYSFTGERILIRYSEGGYELNLSMKYTDFPQPTFIFDNGTYTSLGLSLSQLYGNSGITNMEIWFAMKHR